MAPYKKLEQDLPENDAFNTQVFQLCIQSEHAIGFLKECFYSLKNLHINICDKNSHILTTYWVAVCISLHLFAMQCEEKERELDSYNSGSEDPFVTEALSFLSSDSNVDPAQSLHAHAHTAQLQVGKVQCENLKAKLFQAQAHHAAQSHAQHGISSGSDSSII